jgi:glucose/arabinose dehydrogenase
MPASRFFLILLAAALILTACVPAASPTPTAAPASSGTPVAPVPSPALTVAATATSSATATSAATAVPAPTAQATAALTDEPTSTPTDAPTGAPPTATTAPTATTLPPTASPTADAQPTPAALPTVSRLPTTVHLQQIAGGLTAPVLLLGAPDHSGRLFVVDQVGVIWLITASGQLAQQPFLDLRSELVSLNPGYDERGLLGLAFHPAYASNGRFFVYYSAPLRQGAPAGFDNTVRISEFQVSKTDPDRADPASEHILLQIDEPESNHEGGALTFGPDGYLYIGVGDGGNANDVGLGHAPQGNGQDTGVLLGKVLRLDVNHAGANGAPYAIPPDNPFANGGGAPEIYAYGFRNPYRMAFDRGGNHRLIVADVGQNLFEEVDVVSAGGNYGWNIREGRHCFSPDSPSNPPATCPTTGANGKPLVGPVLEQSHNYGIAIVGGYVYRGAAVPALAGVYVFGEWGMGYTPSGRLYAALPAGSDWQWGELQVAGQGALGHFVLGFGQDEAGELYVLTSDASGPRGNTGLVWKIAQ